MDLMTKIKARIYKYAYIFIERWKQNYVWTINRKNEQKNLHTSGGEKVEEGFVPENLSNLENF